MKFTLKKFYSNNYKDFIHLEALKNILRQVPRLKLAEVKNIDNVLSMEFSVDEWGENPMYITYLDDEGKKHIVKIRPAVTEQIYEILKEYAKITYVDEQDQKVKDELCVEIAEGDKNTLVSANQYTDTVVNNAKAELNLNIETAKEDLKAYCDNKCELTLISSKNYTDAKADELHQRIDEEHEYNEENYIKGAVRYLSTRPNAGRYPINRINTIDTYKPYGHLVTLSHYNVNETNDKNYSQGFLLTVDGYNRLVSNMSKAGIPIYLNVGTGEPLFVSEIAFTLAQYNDQDFMWANIKDGVNDLRAILINEENMQKLYDLDLSGYASKEELDALDTKVDLINQQVDENKTNIENNSNRIDDANQLITDNDAKTSEELGKINDKLDNLPTEDIRLTEIPKTGKATYISWYPDHNVNYTRLINDGDFIRAHINQPDGNETIVYLPKSKVSGGTGDSIDHTLSIVTQTGDVVVESDTPAKAIRFAPLVLSGDTNTENHVSVETTQCSKVFNFLPDGVNKSWFTQTDDSIQNIILDADNRLQEYFQWQAQTNTSINNIMQIIEAGTSETGDKKLLQISNITAQTDGGNDVSVEAIQKNSYYITFGTNIYVNIDLQLVAMNTTTDASTWSIDFDCERIGNDNETITLNSLYAFSHAVNGDRSTSYMTYIDSYYRDDVLKNHFFFMNPVKSDTSISDGVFITTSISGFVSTLN